MNNTSLSLIVAVGVPCSVFRVVVHVVLRLIGHLKVKTEQGHALVHSPAQLLHEVDNWIPIILVFFIGLFRELDLSLTELAFP